MVWQLALLMIAVLWPCVAHAAGPAGTSPPISEFAIRDIDFVPRGWKLLDKVEGDLNGDGRDDVALVIQRNDPAGVLSNTNGVGVPEYDTNPRILLVAVHGDDFTYHLVARNDRIIPDWDSPTISDPYADLAIEEGKLTLFLQFFANAGTWYTYSSRFHFRWSDREMELIGYDYVEVKRNTGDMKEISVNYLTRRRKDGVGRIDSDEMEETWSTLPHRRPEFDKIGNGFEFEP